MDQAKFKIPRVRCRSSKLYTKLFRPRLHIAAVWGHGAEISFSIADEDLKKDSSTQCEIIARCIDSILAQHQTLPQGLALQQDNCVREGKNQYLMSTLCLWVACGTYRWATASFLRVGHSAFGILFSRLHTFKSELGNDFQFRILSNPDLPTSGVFAQRPRRCGPSLLPTSSFDIPS